MFGYVYNNIYCDENYIGGVCYYFIEIGFF